MSARIGNHIRSNIVGYMALFVALSGTAYAVDGPLPGQNQVGSEDIINGEVKRDDIGSNAVRTGKVLDETLLGSDIAEGAIGPNEVYNNSLGSVDLGIDSVAYSELSPAAFNGEIAETGSAFGIADNSIQTNEVSQNSLTGSDIYEASLTPSIHAVAASSSDSSDGPMISSHTFASPTTVITDEIGAGTWIVFGEVGIRNDDTNPTIVRCGIWTDDTLREDAAEGLAEVPDYSGDRVNLPLTAAFTTSRGATLRLACSNAGPGDDGELRPRSADLVAIPVVSLG
jgi:hypothetical protein